VITTGSIPEASAKNERKRPKAEDRLPQAADQDAALAGEQRRIIAAERFAAEERAKARLAWERHEAEKAAIEGRERVIWIVTVLSILLLVILGLIHRMQQPEQKTSLLRRVLAMASLAQPRASMGAISRAVRSLLDKAIRADGRRSPALIP
jgi:cytochrome c-type biogenesis protein CcmH/NrfG